MSRSLLPLLAGLSALLGTGLSDAAEPTTVTSQADVIRLDPALDQVISSDAHLVMLKQDYFGIAEGPVWVADGNGGALLFSDIAANVIYRWSQNGELSVYQQNSGYTGDIGSPQLAGYITHSGPLYIYNFGSNGITLDRQGRLVFCAQGDRAIVRLERNGTRTVLADRYDGQRLNLPNDVIVKSDGTIYFTQDLGPHGPHDGLPYSALFMIKDGVVHMLGRDFTIPNGLAFSPDERYFYVNDRFRIYRYETQPDDTIARRRVFVDMTADKTPGAPDGMKVDRAGHVYCMGPGGIWIMSSDGKHIGTIVLPEPGTNLAFGDADYRTLYITDRHSLLKIRLNTAGIAP